MNNDLFIDFLVAAKKKIELAIKLESDSKIIELNSLINPLYYFSIELGYDKGNIPHPDFFFLICEIKASAYQIASKLLDDSNKIINSNDLEELKKFNELISETKNLIFSIKEIIDIPDSNQSNKEIIFSIGKFYDIIQKKIDDIEINNNNWVKNFNIKLGSDSDRLTRLAFYILCSGDIDTVDNDLLFKPNGDYNSDFFPIYDVLTGEDCNVALKVIDLAIQKDSNNLFAKMLRCIANFLKDERNKAINEMEELLEQYPKNPLLLIELSYFYYMTSKDATNQIELALNYKGKLPFNYINYTAFNITYNASKYSGLSRDELIKKMNNCLDKNLFEHNWISDLSNFLFQFNVKRNFFYASLPLQNCYEILNNRFGLTHHLPLLKGKLSDEGYSIEYIDEILGSLSKINYDNLNEKLYAKRDMFDGYKNSFGFKEFECITIEEKNQFIAKVIIDELEFIVSKNDIILYDFNMFYDDFEKYYNGLINFKSGKYFITNNDNVLKIHLYKIDFA
jgi:hypothetical protein